MAGTFLWNFIKIRSVVSEKKMFKEKVNARADARTQGRTTDNRSWHKLAGLWPVELKIVWKGENAGNQHFLSFPQCFHTQKENFSVTFILSSVSAFNLDKPKFCCLVKKWNELFQLITINRILLFERYFGKKKNIYLSDGVDENQTKCAVWSSFTFFPKAQCVRRYSRQKVNCLPNDKILDWSKFKVFADDKIRCKWKIAIHFEVERKHCGKRRKC